MVRTHIFHIADIHIHSHNFAHIAHAWKQLVAAILAFPSYKTTVMLAIAGDIFDHKMWLQADDITLFNSMMADLERNEILTIMMPGNHDYNINQGGRETNSSDKIQALTRTAGYKFITHCSLSCIHKVDNLAFFIHSPIDLGTPRPGDEHRAFKKIAMVHEPLTNSRTGSGITFQSQRFSAANFAPVFDLTLLGDIHLPQKLAQNVAYAGSFVQKNRGEGLEHGYFLWELEKNNGRFIEIPQLSLHIKVNAVGDAAPVLPMGSVEKPIVARSVQLHYTGCTDEWVRKYSSVLQETYKKPIDGAYNRDKLGITEIKSVAPAPTVGELDTMILSKLNPDANVLPKQRDRVVAIHRKLFEEHATRDAPPGDWRIRHLSWSNLYCYGEDNWLDFDALDNLNSILGPNKTGKSSIIDILILVLFNEAVRGAKKSALNTSTNRGHIKCVISVGSDSYSIERAWIDTNNVVVRLYKNGVNISGTDMPSTYQILENIIGSKRVFINTAVALQQRQFLVDLSPKERYELVCRMIDLDRLRTVEDENRVSLRVEKKLRLSMGEPKDIAAMRADETKLRGEIESHNQTIASCLTRMELIRARINLLTPDSLLMVPLSCSEISRRITAIEHLGDFCDQELLTTSIADRDRTLGELSRLTRDIDYATEKITQLRDTIQAPPQDTTFEICEKRIAAMSQLNISAAMNDFTRQNGELADVERLAGTLRGELESCLASIQAESAKIPPGYRPSAEIDAEIAILVDQEFTVPRTVLDEIPRLKTVINTNTDILVAKQAKLAQLNNNPHMPKVSPIESNVSKESITDATAIEAEIKTCEHLLAGFSQSAESIARLGEMTKESIVTDIFQWSSECTNCAHNKDILENSNTSSVAVNTELARIESARKTTEVKLQQHLSAAHAYYLDETKQLALTIQSDYNQLTSICKRRDAADSANKRHAQLITLSAQSKEYESLLSSLAEKRARVETLRPEIAKLDRTRNNLKSEIAVLQDQIAMYQSLEGLRATYAIFVANRAIHSEISKKEAELRGLAESKQTKLKVVESLKEVINRAEFHKAKIAEMEELTGMFATAQVAEDARDEIESLSAELNQRAAEHKSLLGVLAQSTHALGMSAANITAAEATNATMCNLDMKIADMELYDRIINHKTGIPMEMMRSVCARIQNKCNEVFEQVADFRIGVVFDDEVHINVISGTSIVCAEQSSGYQKFIIDIIMRQVLCSLTASGCPRILFVDEGFGSADESNFGAICRNVLPILARNFEKVIVISHIAGIHEYTTGNIVVKSMGDKSKLEFGPKDVAQMKLRVIDDHAESQKAAHEEKEARKAVDKAKRAAEREQKKQDDKKNIGARLDGIGDTIFTRVDPKTVKCEACEKVFKETLNFSAKHIASAAHLKNLAIWLKKMDGESDV